MKCWYPGPAVEPAFAREAQLSNTLGRIEPGWNELPDGPELAAALEAGLVAPGPPVVVLGEATSRAEKPEFRESRGRRRRQEKE